MSWSFTFWTASHSSNPGRVLPSAKYQVVSGEVVDPRIKRDPIAKVNLHQMPGSHSITQLTSTIKAQLTAIHDGGHLKVAVEVANVAAGHYVPTGSPLRQLVLELRADSYDGRHLRQERVYQRTVADQHGTVLNREYLAFLKAAKVVSDTRLAPGEKRLESFVFEIPAGVQTQVRATFWYYYSPLATTESQKRVTFLELNRLVR